MIALWDSSLIDLSKTIELLETLIPTNGPFKSTLDKLQMNEANTIAKDKKQIIQAIIEGKLILFYPSDKKYLLVEPISKPLNRFIDRGFRHKQVELFENISELSFCIQKISPLEQNKGGLGILVGRFAKHIMYNDKALPHNMSTIPTILMEDDRGFDAEKEKLKQKIITFQNNGSEKCTSHPHPFFGKLTSKAMGKRNIQASRPSFKTIWCIVFFALISCGIIT